MSAFRALRTVVGLGMLLWAGVGGVLECHAQPDSVRTEILKEKGFSPDHSPRNALWRAAAMPGWGQVYNRQYLKLPFVYAGFAAIGFRVYRAHQRYKLFQRAHLYKIGASRVGDNPNEYTQFSELNEYARFEEQYNEVRDFTGDRASEMRRQRDRFRRKRDLSILGVGAFYALTLLDAYVSAHLLTFDVGEELSVRVHPTLVPNRPLAAPGQSGPTGGHVQLRLRF